MKTNEPSPSRAPLRRRHQRYDWPQEAEKLARQKPRIHPCHLVQQLQEMTGYPRDACWRFVNKFGIQRPTRYRSWPQHDQAKVLEMSETRTVQQIAKHFGVSIRAIYHILAKHQRQVSRRSEWFGVHSLARLLTVKPARIMSWIASGQLRAIVEQHGQVRYTLVSGADLVKFCKEHIHELIRRGIPQRRILFLIDYVIPGDVPDDYSARSSKLEREAFKRGEYLNATTGPEEGEEEDDDSGEL